MATDSFEIPQQLRDTAEKSVEQAKQAFDQFLDATQKASTSSDGVTKAVSEGATDIHREAIAAVEENVAATLDLAQRVVQARTIGEITALQQEYFQRQAAKIAKQGEGLGKMVGRVVSEVAEKKD